MAATPLRAIALGNAQSLVRRIAHGVVAVVPVPRKGGAVPDAAAATTSGIATARVAGLRTTGSNVASGGGSGTPVSCAALVPAHSLRAVLVGRLNEGVHAVRAAVLPMSILAPFAQGLLNARPSVGLGLLGRLLGVSSLPGVNGVAPTVQAAVIAATTTRSAPPGRLGIAVTQPPVQPRRKAFRVRTATRRVPRLAVRGTQTSAITAGPTGIPPALPQLLIPTGTMAVIGAAVGAQGVARTGRPFPEPGGAPGPAHGLTHLVVGPVHAPCQGPTCVTPAPRTAGNTVTEPCSAQSGIAVSRRSCKASCPAGATQRQDRQRRPARVRR